MLERVSSICTRLLLTTTPSECTTPVLSSRFVWARLRKALSTDLAKLSFTRSLTPLGGGCTPAKKPRSQYLSPCITVWPAFVAGAGAKIQIYCRRRRVVRARAHTQKQHHHLESESISILFARLFFAVHTDQSLLWGPVKSRRSKRWVKRKKWVAVPENSADHANESCFAARDEVRHDFQLSFITTPTTAERSLSVRYRFCKDSAGAPAVLTKHNFALRIGSICM